MISLAIIKEENVFFMYLEESTRGWGKKKFTNVFCHTAKMTSPRVKSQARGQNNRSSALKWGIVHLCSSITFRDTTKFMKKLVFQILHFCKKNAEITMLNCVKCENLRKMMFFLFSHISKTPWVTKMYNTSF